jgi:hypothetical protein
VFCIPLIDNKIKACDELKSDKSLKRRTYEDLTLCLDVVQYGIQWHFTAFTPRKIARQGETKMSHDGCDAIYILNPLQRRKQVTPIKSTHGSRVLCAF